MNGLSAMPELDCRRQAAFYLGLAQTVLPALAGNVHEGFASQVVDTCWRSIEHQDVDGQVLLDLIHSEEDTGVNVIMGAEDDRYVWNLWACLVDAQSVAAYCAYKAPGDPYLPEMIENIDVEDTFGGFMDSFRAVGGNTEVVAPLREFLAGLHDDQLTRSVVSEALDRLINAA